MTKTITLIRHLKSNWDDASLTDKERPLAPRGKAAGPMVAAAIVAQCPKPDLIICSPAKRTYATLGYVLREIPNMRVTFDDRIYEATACQILKVLTNLDDHVRHVMLIGHNPGMLDMAWELDKSPDPELSIFQKYPTGSVTAYKLRIQSWKNIKDSKGTRLAAFSPKMLMKQSPPPKPL